MKHLLVLTLEGKMDQLNASMLQKAKRRNLRVLKLSNTSKDDLVALAKCPATHDLELFALPTGRTASAICAFFRAMQMPKLKMLEFGSDDQLTSKAIEAIANCSRLTNLQALTFERANIGDEGASILAKSKYLTKLRYLNLAGTHVTEKGIAVLRKKYPDAVIIPSNQP